MVLGSVQGDHGDQSRGFVDFNFAVPLSETSAWATAKWVEVP